MKFVYFMIGLVLFNQGILADSEIEVVTENSGSSPLQYTPEEYNKCMTCINNCWPYVGTPYLVNCQTACWVGDCFAYCHDQPMSPCPISAPAPSDE